MTADDPKTDHPPTPPTTSGNTGNWIRALGLVGAIGLAAFDLTVPDADVPAAVWALIGLIVGVGGRLGDLIK